jgi:hypothetical protein
MIKSEILKVIDLMNFCKGGRLYVCISLIIPLILDVVY